MSSKPKSAGTSLVYALTLILIGMLVFGINSLAKTVKSSYAENSAAIQDIKKAQAEQAGAEAKAANAAAKKADAAASPTAGADIDAGKAKYMTCIACHGPNGEGMAAMKSPALSGQDADYIIRQLQNFKNGHRGADMAKDMQGGMMAPMAKTLSDDDMKNVAAYIQTLKGKAQHSLKGDAASGKAKFMLCVACHGPNGEGVPATKAPALTNLPDEYIVRQLQNFKNGVRGADATKDMLGSQMAAFAKMLSDDDMKNIAEYIKTLKK